MRRLIAELYYDDEKGMWYLEWRNANMQCNSSLTDLLEETKRALTDDAAGKWAGQRWTG